MDYDRKKSKFRSDMIESRSSYSRRRDNEEDFSNNSDYYYDSYKRSRSRSRSRSHSRSRGHTREKSSTKDTPSREKYSSRSNQPHDSKKYDESSYNNLNKIHGMTHQHFNQQYHSRQSSSISQTIQTPSRTIMLRQLPIQMDDTELRNEFNILMIPYKDIRLVRHRDTGTSRGFAFIEFNTVDEAQHLMHNTQGWMVFSNYDNRVQLFYSNSNDDSNSSRYSSSSNEWDCAKCGVRNFKKRDSCFKCHMTKEESERRMGGEGFDHTASTPCNTIIIRGLDALTSDTVIIDFLNKTSSSTLPIKNCRIARDSFTNVSMGFCFVEMTSIQDAGYMLQLLQPNFEIEGKQCVANYSKNTFKTALNQIEAPVFIPHQQSSYNEGNYTQHKGINNRTNQGDQANSAAAVAQAAMANMHKKQEILSHITSNLKQTTPPYLSSSSTLLEQSNNPPDLDTAIGTNLKMLAKQVDVLTKVYATPDHTKFTYDETSGYYYDYTTGFYYDPVSQYYFNSLTQQYMYWDPTQYTYIPVTANGTPSTETVAATSVVTENYNVDDNVQTTSATLPSTDTETTQVKPVIKTAAQIAKDMASWAKSMNKKKDVKKPTTAAPVGTTLNTTNTFVEVKPQGFKAIEKQELSIQAEQTNVEKDASLNSSINLKSINDKREQEEQNPENTEASTEASKNGTIKSGANEEENFIDLTKIACLLCKRRFETVEILNKHILKSDLHKTNLEKFKIEQSQNEHKEPQTSSAVTSEQQDKDSDSLLAALQYRDRAKERREKYGTPEPPSPKYSSSSLSQSHKTKSRDRDNDTDQSYVEKNNESVASKLMRKMGWNEGSGIGKNLQGIAAPIEATMRQKGAGLGSTTYDMDPNDSYKDAARKSARARYEQLN